jgi:uncharacterized protein YkwD
MRVIRNVGWGVVMGMVALAACHGDDSSTTGSSGSGGGNTGGTGGTAWWGDGQKQAPSNWDSVPGQTYPGMYYEPGGSTGGGQVPTNGAAFYPESGHPLCCPSTCPTNTPLTNQREADLRTLINAYRLNNGLSQLTLDPKLDDVARAEVKHQYIHGYSTSTNPEGDDVNGRLSRVSVASIGAQENVVSLDADAQQIFDAMKADPVMNQKLLDPQADALGVGHTQWAAGDARTSVVINRTN